MRRASPLRQPARRAARRARSGRARRPARPSALYVQSIVAARNGLASGGATARSESSVSVPAPSVATTGRPPGPSSRSTTASAPVRTATSATRLSTSASKSSVGTGSGGSLRAATTRSTAWTTLDEIASRWPSIFSRTASSRRSERRSRAAENEQRRRAREYDSACRDDRSHHLSSAISSPRALYAGHPRLATGVGGVALLPCRGLPAGTACSPVPSSKAIDLQ